MGIFGRKKNSDTLEEDRPIEVVLEREQLPTPPAADEHGRRDPSAHRDYLLSLIEPLPPFGMHIIDAVGHSLCEDLTAYQDVPGVDVARVEGFAVNSADVANATTLAPVRLPIAGAVGRGEQATGFTPEGSCVKMVVGAPMPAGTDAVVGAGDVVITADGDADFYASVVEGQNVRAAGSDVIENEQLLRQGEVVVPSMVGKVAAAGIDRVFVRPRPRIVVLATGVELVEPGHPLTHDFDTYDVNSYLLSAAVAAEGAQVWRVGCYTRDPHEIREVITDQLIRADIVITTGGVTLQDNVMRRVVPDLGLTDFSELALEPGAHQGFGLVGVDQVPMVMLPSDPYSAYVGFHLFVRPLIRKLRGRDPVVPPLQHGIATRLIRGTKGIETWLRGELSDVGGRRMVTPLHSEGVHDLSELATANVLIRVPADTGMINGGQRCDVLPVD